MSYRRATDTTTPAADVSEVVLIDPATRLPYAAGGSGGGGDATAANQDEQTTILAAQLAELQSTTPAIVVGGQANDAALTGAPVPIGGLAKNTNPTKVGDGDAVYTRHDLTGRPVMTVGQQRDLQDDQTSAFTSTTTAATIVAAQGAGVYADITALVVANKHATTSTLVEIYNDDGTTVRLRFQAPANSTVGIVLPRILKAAAANATWKAKTLTSVDSVYITAFFDKNV